MAPPAAPGRTRLGELDALRGVAAVSVVVYHYTLFLHDLLGFRGPSVPGLSWLYPFKAGEYGVSLFFIISGFVIFMTLQRTKRSLDFVVSRFARLYPAYWCGMTVTALVRILIRGDSIGWLVFLANLTMVPTCFGQFYVDGVYWTLGVELQFYAIMLLLWRLGLLRRIEWVSAAWLGLLVAAQVASRVGPLESASELVTTALILKHIPLFAAGMVFHRIHEDRLTAARMGLLCAALGATWLSGNITKAIVVTLSFGALTLLVSGRLAALGRSKVWLWLGDRSYAIYLVHMLIGLVLMQRVEAYAHNVVLVTLVPLVSTFTLATLIHRLVEKPALAGVRRRYSAWLAIRP